MTDQTDPAIRFERTYDAPAELLWELWTTKAGLESWWGPVGFRIEVRELDLRVGGRLSYDMIADTPEMAAYMKTQGMGDRHDTHGVFVEIVPARRLKIEHTIDFIPGVEPYPNTAMVELVPEGGRTKMVITVEPHRDAKWTEMARAGWESQLTKLPAVIEARLG